MLNQVQHDKYYRFNYIIIGTPSLQNSMNSNFLELETTVTTIIIVKKFEW